MKTECFQCSVVVLLVCFLALASYPAAEPSPAQATLSQTNFDRDGLAAEVYSALENEATTEVIVTLDQPDPIERDENLTDEQNLEAFRGQNNAAEETVLARYSSSEFQERYCFDNFAGFTGAVSAAGLQKLLADPSVKYVEPVRILEAHLAQGIPLMNATAARASGYNGAGLAIAVCDTGIDYTHPRLGGGGFPNSKVLGGYDFGDSDADPIPNAQAHGTCCAGIAAGDLGTVGDYIGGVASSAKLYALKISYGTAGSATTAAMVSAWDWCVTHQHDNASYPIMVISTSFGGNRFYSNAEGDAYSPGMTTAANNAITAGITVLASSGNDGYCDSMAWPAAISSVISVGAVYDASFGTYEPCVKAESCAAKIYTASGCSPYSNYYVDDPTSPDRVTAYSNAASFLTLLAPSNSCYTTDIAGSSGYSSGDYYSSFGGTSAACPYAAGAVACLQTAAMSKLGHYLTPAEVRSTLVNTGANITDPKVAITKPRVNLQAAVDSIVPPVTVTSFAINSGAASTTNPIVTLNNTCTGSPTHYMASELLSFSGASWQTYATAPTFTLSSGSGTKTVYCKVKNASVESAVVTDAIATVVPTITSFAINGGAASTTSQAVTLNNTSTGIPTHYMASESPGFSGASWQTYATAPPFTLSPGYGTKTVYFKVKNAVGESPVTSDSIVWSPVPLVTLFRINYGAGSTTSRTVTLNNTCTNTPTDYMASESSSFSGASWQPYSAAPAFTLLSPGPGTKFVYFKARNAAGESTVVSDDIFLNEKPAVTSFAINGGAASTASQTVTLDNICKGSPTYYMASESSSFAGASWQTYSTAPTFILSSGGVTKTVYLKVKNLVGESPVVSDDIAVNGPPIVTSFVINGGAASTAIQTVTLDNTCTGSPTYYMASESSSFAGASWQTYATAPTFTLSSGNGTKTVYFKVKNTINESVAMNDTIVYISGPPPPVTLFRVNYGAGSTTDRTVTLNNTCTNIPTDYMASESSSFSGASWQPYSTAPAFTLLSPGPGTKFVYFKARNAAGESTVVSDDIFLNEKPAVTSFAINGGAASTASQTVTLDNICKGSPTYYMASESSSFAGASWQTYSTAPTFILSSGGVTKTVYLKVKNLVGESPVVSDDIAVNGPPVVTSFVINGGAASTAIQIVTLNNTCTGSPTYYMASESSSFTGASWQPYATAPTFTLSSGNGTKTVYFKVKNTINESSAMNDTIVYIPGPPPTVTLFKVDYGAGSTKTRTVTLNNTCTNSPTEYTASESSDFTGATWQPYSTAPAFTLTSGNGTKTVYFKAKNASGESAVVSDTIVMLETPAVTSFAINNGDASTANPTVALNNACTGSPTYYMASESPTFSGASWLAYSMTPTFVLSPASGTKTVYFKVKSGAGESGVASDTIVLIQ